jgi:hypothetical protein
MHSLSPPRVTVLHDRAVRKLVDAHAENRDDRLLLAVRYGLEDEKNIHLLEVLEEFPGPADDRPYTTEFEATPDLIIEGKLYLTLASPAQLRAAIERNDPLIVDVRAGRGCRVEFQTQEGQELARILGAKLGVSETQQSARLRFLETFSPDEKRASNEESQAIRESWKK